MTEQLKLGVIEQGMKEKVLFKSALKGGTLDMQDLFDLPVSAEKKDMLSLKALGRELSRELRDSEDDCFAEDVSSPADKLLQLKVDIIKRIIEIKTQDRLAAEQAKAYEQQDKLLSDIIARKELGALEGKSLEEVKEIQANLRASQNA